MDDTMILRNEAVKKGDVWVATCLELGIIITSPKLENVKSEMTKAIDLYLEGLEKALRAGKDVRIVPVPHYWLRKLRFDLYQRLQRLQESRSVVSRIMWKKEHSCAF
ncbi:MAG: hypothetical protein GX205_04015 [Firmicutes bacterium]|nr:hypothetical protein [Bacillota bacterium]